MSKMLAENSEIEGKVRTNLFIKNAIIAKLLNEYFAHQSSNQLKHKQAL